MNDAWDQDRKAVARRAAQMLQAGLDELESVAREVELETGQRVLHRRPSMADATRADLEQLLVQVQLGERALKAALEWVAAKDTLGAVLKRMERTAAFELAEKLRAAGLDV